jgi:alpha-2-macroglobulin
MKPLRLASALAIVLSLLSGCGASNTVEVLSFTPEGESPLLTTIEVEFSRDLAPPEAQQQWLSDEFIRFSPEIRGRFKWTSARRLIFSPDVPLQPMQKYTATVTEKVLYDTEWRPAFKDRTFNTPDFDVRKADLFWTHIPRKYYTVTIQANLHFTYPVDPAVLLPYLEILHDGKPVSDAQIISEQSSEVIAVAVGEVQQKDKAQKITLRIREGLASTLGRSPLSDTREFVVELPPITELAVTGVVAGYDGETGWIEVAATQTIDEEQAAEFISVQPQRRLRFFTSDNILRIEGDFESEQSVTLVLRKGLPGLFGGVMQDEYRQQVSFVDIRPGVNFADRGGRYLMRGGYRNLEVHAVNIDELDIDVYEIFRNNVLHFVSQNSWWSPDYDYNPDYYVGDLGMELYRESVPISSGRNWLGKHTLNLDRALASRHKGIYVVRVSSSEDRWLSDSKIIAMSDIALIARIARDQVMVFANSISSTLPIAGLDIQILSSNNQTLLSGTTDASGMVTFTDFEDDIAGFTPRLVVASNEEDFNFLDLRDALVETSRHDVGGLRLYSHSHIAFMYGDRDIYRPGERGVVSGIVRTDDMRTVADAPVLLTILNPRGRSFSEYKLALNRQGSFEQTFDLPVYALTGEYRAELRTGGDQLIGVYSFSVEDVLPDKIRVLLKTRKEKLRPGENFTVDTDAEYLFGAKAANLRYEADVQFRHRPFRSQAFSDYDFSRTSTANTPLENSFLDGILDENGAAVISHRLPEPLQAGGVIDAAMYVSVFDLTGRTVNRSAHATIYSKPVFIGIKSPGSYFAVNKQANFSLVAVDAEDKARSGEKVDVHLVRLEWQTVLKKDYAGRYYYASEQREIHEWDRRISLQAGTQLPLQVRRSGKYQLRVFRAGASDYVYSEFYAYGWGTSTASSFEVDKEGRVDIIFDKEQYRPGESANVLFMCPFAGRLLITVERNGVMHHQYVDVENRSAEVKLTVKPEYMPNAYITATLFRRHQEEKDVPFLVGHGFASMSVEMKEYRLPVSIQAPSKVKPNSTQSITIKTAPQRDIYVTLAAVDEGLLQIKDYVSPDPYATMYARRALQVQGYDLYKFLLPEIVRSSSLTGGDGMLEEGLKKRVNPVNVNRVTLLSYWSGIRKSDSKGNVKIRLPIPQFNGEVRLMAVAYSNERFGSSAQSMKVADDLILEPQLPRLLSAGDSLVIPVTLVNTTAKRGQATVTLEASGSLALRSKASQAATVPAGGTAVVEFSVRASDIPGSGVLAFRTSGMATVRERHELAVRPSAPFSIDSRSGVISKGGNVSLPAVEGYMKGTASMQVTLSSFPAVRFAKQLRQLVSYPHGCLEQTVSTAFPQLYLEAVLKLAAPEHFQTRAPSYYVNLAIRKVESMQIWDGSIAYWPGSSEGNWWGSVYSAHFLLEAKKARYRVSEQNLQRLLRYIANKSKQRETYQYVQYTGGGRSSELKARKEILYGLYVLALAGRADVSTMNYYRGRMHLLSSDSRYMLAGAFAQSGRWNTWHTILPASFSGSRPERETGGSFDSELRANALKANILLDNDPSNRQIPVILRYLADRMDQMYSTQETAFAMLALGKAARRSATDNVTVGVFVDGKKKGEFKGKDIRFTDKEIGSGRITLKAEGQGSVYYFWAVEGIRTRGQVPEQDANMSVRRSYFDYRSRSPIEAGRLRQGQLIVCRLSLTGAGRSIENVVLTDMIPAGCEIENPRLRPSTALGWEVANPMDIAYMDVRDDRMILFTSLFGGGTRDFIYLMRVVNQGRFVLPPVTAEAMYDPAYSSTHGAGVVTVSPMRYAP